MNNKLIKKIKLLNKIKDDLERWDDLAGEYIKYIQHENGFVDTLRSMVLTPELLNVVGPAREKKIIDAGCGEGYLSRILAREGAKVVGIDGSRTMIQQAVREEKLESLGIQYILSNLVDLVPLERESFDAIIANMVFFSIKDIELVIKSLSAYLKRGGEFTFSILHPCFHLNNDQWENIHNLNFRGGKLNIKLTESYKDEKMVERPYIDSANKIKVYLRPIEFYCQQFFKLGFALNDLREPRLRLDNIKEGSRYYHAYLLPRFLILKFKKP